MEVLALNGPRGAARGSPRLLVVGSDSLADPGDMGLDTGLVGLEGNQGQL